jgi:hypothetical protein
MNKVSSKLAAGVRKVKTPPKAAGVRNADPAPAAPKPASAVSAPAAVARHPDRVWPD